VVWSLDRDRETGMEVCPSVRGVEDDPWDGRGGAVSGGSGSAEVRGKGGWKRGVDLLEAYVSGGSRCVRNRVGGGTGYAREEVDGEEEEEDVEND
jgi:hypothetical protein